MDAAQYYITTLSTAAGKIGPILLFLLIGYFVFIKLPFMFAMKVSKDHKPNPEQKKNPQVDHGPSHDQKVKIDSMPHEERINTRTQENSERHKKKEEEREEERLRQERKKEERERARAQEEKKNKKTEEKSQHEQKPKAPASTSAAEIFELRPGEEISKSELKKRYHDLLRQNHPDKVASLGADFKKLAEKKTKEINSAYEELKKKAS